MQCLRVSTNVYEFRFPDGHRRPSGLPGTPPLSVEQDVKDAARKSGAKIDSNRVADGIRTMTARTTSFDVELRFYLATDHLSTFRREVP